jgi:creatinine amidohydrolase
MKRPAREGRIEYLKGRDAVRRLRRTPLGFLPLGSLERHGDHLPMGLDILKAHAAWCAGSRRASTGAAP